MEELIERFEDFEISIQARNDNESKISKSMRKRRKFEAVRERRREKRKEEHRRRRQVLRTTDAQPLESSQLDICIDLSFGEIMSAKEIGKLSRQLGRVWGLQKKYNGLRTTLFEPSDGLLEECRRAVSGFDAFTWNVKHGEVRDNFPDRRIVFLSPDAHHPPLLSTEPDVVYVIGGLVDESGQGSRTADRAASVDCDCYRLPIPEFMRRSGSGTFNVMLTINQVVEILCKFAHSSDWTYALTDTVPKRTGYVV